MVAVDFCITCSRFFDFLDDVFVSSLQEKISRIRSFEYIYVTHIVNMYSEINIENRKKAVA